YQMSITKTREVFSLPNVHYAPFAFVPAFLLDAANGAACLHQPLAIGRSIRFCRHFAFLSIGELFFTTIQLCL
ncbi:MAG: hypothetical protein ACFNJR_08695, partial [Segatella oulorum]|uniref:hypothetical protein n=1 Tax=Segatella oulorum TaxID=28136 RepID=UPI0036222D63